MKRILIVSHAMELGGAERALLGIFENINTEEFHVDLFLLRHQGELLRFIPHNIHLLPENKSYSSLGVPLKEVLKKKKFGIAVARYIGKKKAFCRIRQLRIAGDNNVVNEYSHKYTVRILPRISEIEYDLAISYMSPHYFVAQKVNARKKVAWIHTDYATFKVDVKSEVKMWEKYDNIISISDDVTKSFVQTFPTLSSKIVLIENIIPMRYMEYQANEFSVETEMPKNNPVKLLTIGRFVTAKRMDEIPEICRRIRAYGLDVKWYLIGFGGNEELIRKRIEEAGMQDHVIILGKKENPYPYIKACDIYIQPSRYEGKSIAVREAQLFSKPVVITNYSTAHSQLTDGFDGVIVPMDIPGAAKGIADLIRDEKKQAQLSKNTKQKDYVNRSEIAKIYSLMEN
ncbi:MAG: glycosyltransferase [Faecousia sp.]